MQSDIKSKSTDFLPPKPGDGSTNIPANQGDDTTQLSPPPASDSVAQPAPKSTSKHVIDLKNMDSGSKTSKDFMVSEKPSGSDLPLPPPSPVPERNTSINSSDNSSKIETNEPGNIPVGMKPIEEHQSDPSQNHPQDQEFKDAMVNLDPSKPSQPENQQQASATETETKDNATPKQKKKFPTWAIVLIIVVVVIIVAVGTFFILNSVAPTSLS